VLVFLHMYVIYHFLLSLTYCVGRHYYAKGYEPAIFPLLHIW